MERADLRKKILQSNAHTCLSLKIKLLSYFNLF